MQTPAAFTLLDLWEWGQSQLPVQRALALLEAAFPEESPQALAELSLGRRDARLLALRRLLFGSRLASLVTCPACGERVELNFEVDQIQNPAPALPAAAAPATTCFEQDGLRISFRLPNSLDLLAVAGLPPAEARPLLLERCITAIDKTDGESVPIGTQLPATLAEAILARMVQADPQAEVTLAVVCPACGNHWQAVFDILSYFWSELDAWAERVLEEVHVLASTYHWREADILALSPHRRQAYLERISG